MLEGWYCRTMANSQNAQQEETGEINVDGNDSNSEESNTAVQNSANQVDYKAQYRYLKRKLKFLIYENEFFQDALRSNQRRLLKVSRDRSFLLDRLLHYEKPDKTSSESEETESSDDGTKEAKKRKTDQSQSMNGGSSGSGAQRGRKRKVPTGVTTDNNVEQTTVQTIENSDAMPSPSSGGLQHLQEREMTAAELERHLQSKQSVLELMPETESATVPAEMFSNDPSLDGESNDHIIDGSSPSHVAAEECVPMEYAMECEIPK